MCHGVSVVFYAILSSAPDTQLLQMAGVPPFFCSTDLPPCPKLQTRFIFCFMYEAIKTQIMAAVG